MTNPDDDPQLSWNPDAPAPSGPAADPGAPSGWVQRPRASADRPAEPPIASTAPRAPDPKPVDWGRAPESDGQADAEEPAPPAGSPRHRRRGRKRKRERDRVRSVVEWVAVIVGALVVALVVKTFLFQAFYIPSASMEPALEKGDRVLVNKLDDDVSRGEIVVFELPAEKVGPDGIKDLIKRVVGLPGEVIETRNGLVYIDGERLDEPYLAEGTRTDSPPIERQTVPEDHIFVMGDNRDNSADSRFPNRGPIPIDTVVGRAFIQVWPPTDVGGL